MCVAYEGNTVCFMLCVILYIFHSHCSRVTVKSLFSATCSITLDILLHFIEMTHSFSQSREPTPLVSQQRKVYNAFLEANDESEDAGFGVDKYGDGLAESQLWESEVGTHVYSHTVARKLHVHHVGDLFVGDGWESHRSAVVLAA